MQKVPFHTQNVTHFESLNFVTFDHGTKLPEIFHKCSYSTWLHFDTKSTLISIWNQVLDLPIILKIYLLIFPKFPKFFSYYALLFHNNAQLVSVASRLVFKMLL